MFWSAAQATSPLWLKRQPLHQKSAHTRTVLRMTHLDVSNTLLGAERTVVCPYTHRACGHPCMIRSRSSKEACLSPPYPLSPTQTDSFFPSLPPYLPPMYNTTTTPSSAFFPLNFVLYAHPSKHDACMHVCVRVRAYAQTLVFSQASAHWTRVNTGCYYQQLLCWS